MADRPNGRILGNIVKLGDWLKHEYRPDLGIARTKGALNTARADANTTMQVGDIVYQNDKTGNWLAYAAAYDATADNIGVVADETIYDFDLTSEPIIGATGVQQVAIIVAGAAPVIAREGGLFADAAVRTAGVAALSAAGMTIAEKLK